MLKNLLKRATAGILSVLTVLPCVPHAGAIERETEAPPDVPYAFRSSLEDPYGIMLLAAEDDVASEASINVGEKYVIADPTARRATFLQNGSPRNVWPMYTWLSDNTQARAYCGDHSKSDPGSGGMTFTVTERSNNMRLFGVVTQSDARNTRNVFINTRGNGVLTTENFSDWMYFCASQAAIWAAIGDVGIQAGDIGGVSWESSESLGYTNQAGKRLSASTTEHALTLYAATQMLKFGVSFDAVWGAGGKNHAPYVGAAFSYCPGRTEFDPAAKKTGDVNLPDGILSSGYFAEETVDGAPCLVLPMAAASATFARGNRIFVRMDNPPDGAFLVSDDGMKSVEDNGSQRLTLGNVENLNSLYDNANDQAFGQTFKFCIPKAAAEQMDQNKETLKAAFTCSMNVDRYNVFIAKPPASSVQPAILVEPAVQAISAKVAFHSAPTTITKNTSLRVMKTDKDGKPLPGCTFQISYTADGKQQIKDGTTDSTGQCVFEDLPLNVAVTITETAAPDGYELAEPQTVTSGNDPTKPVVVTIENQDGKDFIIRKISSSDGRKLPDATFEIKCIDNGFSTTLTTGPMGEGVIHGKDLPVGSYEAYEIDAPEGYVLDGTVKTFEWDNTHDVTLTFSDAPEASIEVFKYDGQTKDPLKGATFEIRKDSQVIQTVTTDANGSATVGGLSKGYYQVVEINAPEGYLVDPLPHEVYIDPAADPTSIVRKVSVPNGKKLGLRIVKIDKGTRVPLPGFTFQIFKDGALFTTKTTDDKGEILLENLEPGVYRAHEQGAPEEYNCDAPDQEIEIVKEETEIPTLTFENSKKKGFWLLKKDKESGKPIPGVTFELSRDGKVIGSYTTDDTGYVKLEDVEPGTYVARETAVPDRYIKSEEAFLIEIDENAEDPVIITITNTEKKELLFKKIDEDTGKPMAGVVFEIFLNNVSIGTRTTDANGEIRLPYADPGSYRFEERHTLAGYQLSRAPINIEQTADKSMEVTASNIQRKKLVFHKRDSQSKEPLVGVIFEIFLDGKSLGDYKTDENGEIVIQNAPPGSYTAKEKSTLPEYVMNEDSIQAEHTLSKDTHVYIDNTHRPGLGIRKLDSVTGNPIAGVRFHVWCSPKGTDGDMQDLGEHTTDKDGYILFDTVNGNYLNEGWYKITEVEAAPGYIIKEPVTQTVHIANREYKEVTFYNQPKSGLVIWKYDSVTGKAVAGAVFQVRYLSGSSGTGGTIIGTYKTSPNGSVTVTDLEPGTYVVEEIACPDGYVMDTAPQTVYISENEQAVVEVHFANSPNGDLLIKKLDAITKLPLAGIKFMVKTSEGTVVGNSNGEFVTDETGSILIDGIEPDTSLIINEIETIPGYILDTTPKTITTKAGKTVVATFTNQPDGTIIVEKYDKSTGKPLKGVEFKITAATGELLPDNAGLTSTNGIYTTDANGQIVLNHVKPGSYIITETKPLPGYSIDGETARTVVVQSGNIHTARFYNTPDGTLVVKKIDSVTKEPLSGVKFEIKTISGADFETKVYTTDADGLITLSHLPTGAYAVIEKMALPGYELDDVEQTAHIEPGKTAELTFTNRPLGGLLIRKMDAATREPLGGVTIKVTHADGAVVGASNGEYITDENGYLYIPDLKPGAYIAREVKAKEGYVLDNTPKTIEIKDHQTYTLDFFNQPDGTIIVRKIDSVTKKPLEGAAFRIMTSSGELVGDYPIAGNNTNAGSSSITDVTGQVSSNGIYYTDTNGQIILHSVKPGTYVITETQTIDGYVLNSTPQTVLVGANDTQTITVGNPPKGSLIVRKIDSVTREPLQGVKIKIVTSNGDLVADNEGATSSNGVYVTDENGEITLGRLKPDTYVVTEVETIPGYNMDAQSQTVRVNTNDAQMITLTNTPKGGLVIKKMDAFTKEPLSDVIFKATRADGSVVGTTNGEYRTDENGYVSIIGLEPGGYIVKEARAKSGYVLDNTPREIEIKDHQTYSLEFFNQPKGSLLIRKVDTQTKLPLKGVEFKVTTSSGEAVSPNEGLTSSNGIYTTDENGEIKLNKLLPGTYQVAEIKTLDGYMMDGGTQTVVIGADDAQVLTFTNTRKGSLIVNKVDSVTRAPLAGVTFEIKGYDDNEFPVGTYTTDVNGSFRLDEVPSGVYSIKELETIPGYKLDDTVQTVRVDGGKIKQATFTNDPLGGLLIKKMDSITKEPLSDVTFQITRPDGSVVGNTNGEYRTDAKGYISIPNLAPGSYIVTETQTKTGYVLDNTPREIEIKDHQTYTLEFFNQPHGGLVIRKINSVTKEPLSGVEFKITTADGQLVPDNDGLTSTNGLYTTNEEGEIVLNRIKPGSYIVTETKTIDGYVRNAESQTVVINASDIQTLTFTNPPKGSLVVRKIDGVTKEPLQGVKFKIVASDGKLIAGNEGATSTNGVYVTNENGEIALGNLQPDTYLVTETETIPGYMMDAAPQTVRVDTNDAQVITFTNTPKGGLVLKKMDAITREPLSDVLFKITRLDGTAAGTSNGEYRTDANGYIALPDLEPGGYIITELQTASGYVLDNTPKTIEIKDHQTYTMDIFNQPKGGLVIQKRDAKTHEPLQGVEFKITTASGELVSTNEGLTSSNGIYSTDANGQIVLRKLQPGTYIVAETKTLDDYILDPQSQTVVVGNGDTQTLNFENTPKGCLVVKKIDGVTKEPIAGVKFEVKGAEGCEYPAGIYTTDANGMFRLSHIPSGCYAITETEAKEGYRLDNTVKTVEVEGGVCKEITFENEPLGGLLIKKMDAVTKAPLSDVLFKITKPDGAAIGVSNGEFRTDEYGYISLPDLQPGTYVIKETQEKSGYVLDDTPKTITVNDYQTYNLEIFNQPAGGLIVRKIDSKSRESLSGVQFQITTASGELVPTNEGLTSSNGIYTTDATGEIRLNKLTPGTYIVKETKTIDGYMMDAIPQTVVVKEGDTQTLTFENTPGGSLTVKKINSVTKEPISGVTFEVKGYAGMDYPNGTYTTDANGMFRLDGISTGTYTIAETKAKDGYKLDNTSQTIQINAGESKEVTFENEPLGGLLIKKMDASTKEPLSDVTFKITTLDGTLVGASNGEYRTDENGLIRISDLAPGGYIAQEIQAKPGYLLDDTPKTIEIKDHQTYTLEFFNQPKGGLIIRKVDSKTREPLQGVEFKITTASGEFVSTNEGLTSSNGIYVTDLNGEIVLSKLQPGTYVVTEQKTIDGYMMDAAPQTVVVSENDTQTLTFTNTKKQGLVIRKIDEDTRQPLKNALFSIAKANGEVINGRAETDINGLITINDLEPGAYIISEIKAPDGYVLQEAPMTVEVKTGFPTEVTFTNRQAYGIQIRKVVKGTHEPLGDCKFEVKKANGEFVGAYTTDSAGLATVPELADGVYTVQEVSAPEGYRINREPQNVIVKAGVLATVTFENERLAGIRIKKIDAISKEGIYGVRFLVKDEGNRVIGEYTTDQDGYIDLDELETNGESTVTFKVEEIAAAEGYVLDKKVKTLKVNRGETTELVIENTPILGQIQVCKKAAQGNIVTNQTKGTPLAGAVFEVTNADTGRVVDTITSDARGIAATNPIPLGRYFVQEVKAPACYQLNSQKVEVKLKVEGDVAQIEVYDDAANLKTTIQKTSNQTVDAGANMRYDISGIANESNVALDNFFWHDRIPTDAVRAGSITTGKYSGRAWYKIKFKTNKRDYQTLADHLLSTSSYAFKIDAASLKLAAGEYVTDIRYEFGAVPAGFKMTEKATLFVYVPASVSHGYQIINRADVGGSYNGEWDGATAMWTTTVYRPAPPAPSLSKLPQTGY